MGSDAVCCFLKDVNGTLFSGLISLAFLSFVVYFEAR